MESHYLNNRQIRVFLSSTFRNMQEERDYLVKKTFPAIKRICEKRHIDFSVVDLRWGITEEEAHTGKVIEICFDEIQRTTPFFIGLIGGRYGWIPEKEDLRLNQRLVNRYPWVREWVDSKMSITEMEIQYGVLQNENHVHANFFIRDVQTLSEQERDTKGSIQWEKLTKLIKAINSHSEEGKCNVNYYNNIKELGVKIYNQLLDLINDLYPESEECSIDFVCKIQHAKQERLTRFFENADAICQLEEIWDGKGAENICILLKGEKGVGKSALLANWHKDDKYVIRTFLDHDTDTAREALDHLHAELKRRNIDDLSLATWVIDGIENLSNDDERQLNWISNIDTNIIISTNDSSLEWNVGVLAQNKGYNLNIILMQHPNVHETILICKNYLGEFAKGLTEKQLFHIANHQIFYNVNTLYIFLDELIQFGIYEQLDQFMDNYLYSESKNELLTKVIQRLEDDYGKYNVSLVFGTICLTKLGIPEDNLRSLTGLHNIEWFSFYSAISQFLLLRNGFVTLKDPDMQEIATQRYCDDEQDVDARREQLLEIYKCLLNKIISVKEIGVWRYTANWLFSHAFLYLPIIFKDEISENKYHEIYSEYIRQLFYSTHSEDFFKKHNINQVGCGFDNYVTVSKYVEFVGRDASKININFTNFIAYYHEGIVEPMIELLCQVLENDKKALEELAKKIKRMWLLPPKIRRQALTKIINNKTGCEDLLETNWELMSLDEIKSRINEFAAFVHYLPLIIDNNRIEDILQKADKLISRICADRFSDTYQLELSFLRFIKSYCLLREVEYQDLVDPRKAKEDAYLLYCTALQNPVLKENHSILIDYLMKVAAGNLGYTIDPYHFITLREKVEKMPHNVFYYERKKEILYVQIAITAYQHNEREAYEQFRDELINLYNEDTGLNNWRELKYSALLNCAEWLRTEGMDSASAELYNIAAKNAISDYQKMVCYQQECELAVEYDEAIKAGQTAVDLYKSLVELGTCAPSTDVLYTLYKKCSTKRPNEEERLAVLKELEEACQECGNKSFEMWCLLEQASIYEDKIKLMTKFNDICELYKKCADYYQKAWKMSPEVVDEENYYCGLACGINVIAKGAAFYHVWDSQDPIVQQILQLVEKLFQQIQTDTELNELVGALIDADLYAICLAAAGQFEAMLPLIKQMSPEKKKYSEAYKLYLLNYYNDSKRELVKRYISRQIYPWNKREYWYSPEKVKFKMPAILSEVVHRWLTIGYFPYILPRMEEIVIHPDDKMHIITLAPLLIYYYYMDDKLKFEKTKERIENLIEYGQLDDNNLFPIVLAVELISPQNHGVVSLSALYKKVKEILSRNGVSFDAKAITVQANIIIDQIYRCFYKDYELFDYLPLLEKALNAYKELGMKVPERCYYYILKCKFIIYDWQGIILLSERFISDAYEKNYYLLKYKWYAMFFTDQIEDGIAEYKHAIQGLSNEQSAIKSTIAMELMSLLYMCDKVQEAYEMYVLCKEINAKQNDEFFFWATYILADTGKMHEAMSCLEKTDKDYYNVASVYCAIKQGNMKDALHRYELLPIVTDCSSKVILGRIIVELELIKNYRKNSESAFFVEHRIALDSLLEQCNKRKSILKHRLESVISEESSSHNATYE